MTTITIDRALVEQALKALENTSPLGFNMESDKKFYAAITALRAALAQQTGAWQDGVLEGHLRERERWLAQEPDLSRCPQCNGPADNGHDRSIPPSPYLCTKCMAEPVHKCPNCASLEAQNTELDRKLAEVEQAEREACAKLAESTICDTHLPTGVRIYGTRVADAIRARSKE